MKLKWGPQSLFAKLLAAHFTVIIITLLAIAIVFSYLVEKYYFSAREWDLTNQAEKIAEMVSDEFQAGNHDAIKRISQTLAVSLDVKIRVIDNNKNEIILAMPLDGDLEPRVDLEPNEIDYVLQGDHLSKKVVGPAVQRLLVAIPITNGEEDTDDNPAEIIGVITVSAPLNSIRATITQISRFVIYSLLFSTVVAGLFAFSLAKTISRPLQAMTSAAHDMKMGNFRSRIDVPDKGELGQLAATFNQAVEEINKTVDEQKRLQSLRQNLVASVSHEFRAPLTSIQGFVDAMLEGFVQEEEQEKYLKVILDNTLHLNRLVDDLLELASIESGNVQLRLEDVCPYAIAKRAMDTVIPKAKEKNTTLEYTHEEDLPPLWGDSDRLYQILVNLLENAITYTPAGGRIALESKKNGPEGVAFTVSDNGIGIPAEEMSYIWERFHKVDKARNRANKGKGLGLSIVRKLVQLHNGEVHAESTPGIGSTFRVILPVNSSEKEAKDNQEA